MDDFIWITFQVEGVHKYPAAGELPELADVSFLQYPHRHTFHFKVWLEITHNDRDVEFIQFKRFCQNLYTEGVVEFDYKSCEMLADDLASQIEKAYPMRKIRISVSEDDENGCEKTYNVISLNGVQ